MSTLTRLLQKVLDAKPPTYSKSLILNLFGMQLLITAFYALLYALKGKRVPEPQFLSVFQALERDGYAVVTNFLPPEEHTRVVAEFEKLLPNFQQFDTYTKVALPHVERLDITDPNVSPSFRSLFSNHPLIQSVAQAFLRRKKLLDVKTYLTRISIRDERELSLPQDGGTTNIHIDAPLRVLKCFYFLEPVSESNGTLHYAPGTHRRTPRLLWLEYLHSIRYALNKRRPHPTGQYDPGRPWVEVTDREVRTYGLSQQPVIVPGNTLVILNPGGYHRRGVMTQPGDRKAVEIGFRNADTLRNYARAFWS